MGTINAFRCLHQLRKNQWLKTSELEELQAKKLRAMIKHAYENTEFYHKKLKDAGIIPEDIKNVDDLKKIPFTTKNELRDNLKTILARDTNINKCHIVETSGSSGIQTKVVYDEDADDFSKAVNLRSHIENGLCIRDKWVVLRDEIEGHHEPNKRWFQHLRIFNPMQVSVFYPIDKQISIMRKFRPAVIGGYSSSIELLARAVEKNDIKDIKPNMIFGTSELLDNSTRKYINSIFNVDMIDHFGCIELNRTAWECSEHTGYHIDMDAVIMEFIKNSETVSVGERGEIVYTGLYNYAMPLIRYKIEDIGISSDEKCPCGRGLSLMKIIEGRKDSLIQTPDGRIFSPMVLTAIMEQMPYVKQFKIIQYKKDSIRILIVRGDEFSQHVVDRIELKFKKVVGNDINIKVDIVDDIPKDRSGKIRNVVSNVKIEW